LRFSYLIIIKFQISLIKLFFYKLDSLLFLIKVKYATKNPIQVTNHIVFSLRKIIIDVAKDKAMFLCTNNVANRLSVAPTPPGMKKNDPNTTDE